MTVDTRLIPVDEMVVSLQREIDDMYWEDPDTDNADCLQKELERYLELQDRGVLYEPTF